MAKADSMFTIDRFSCPVYGRVTERLQILNPTLHFQVGNVASLPVLNQQFQTIKSKIEKIVEEAVSFSKKDWDSFEFSWDFQRVPWLQSTNEKTFEADFQVWTRNCRQTVQRMQGLETENNRLFIEAYELKDEMSPEVPEEQVTLTVNPKYRYGVGLTDEEYQKRFRYDSTKELLSYSVGCMMGRYSLDKPGLVYANEGNEGFDHLQYKTFPADDDGIVSVSDIDWFADDATPRLVEFIKTVFGAETLDENLEWVAASFEPKKGESPIDAIRRYFSTKFFKDHMQMYKKRPIYWLFSSGKQKCLTSITFVV